MSAIGFLQGAIAELETEIATAPGGKREALILARQMLENTANLVRLTQDPDITFPNIELESQDVEKLAPKDKLYVNALRGMVFSAEKIKKQKK